MSKLPRVCAWPIGYRAGLAISNDAEYLTLNGLLSLNSLFSEVLGRDKFSTSAFLMNYNPGNPGFALYSTNGQVALRPEMLKILEDYLVDGIHSLVDNDLGNASISRTKEAVDHLSARFQFNWWSNHGGKMNRQNIGHQFLSDYQEGDLRESECYSLDSARKLGVMFYSLDDNNHLHFRQTRRPIIELATARDETSIAVFHRFRGLAGAPAPTLESLHLQITRKRLRRLLRFRRGIVVYQHLGIASRVGREVGTVVESESDIPNSAVQTLRVIREAQEEGLWVAKLSNFLNFVWARDNLIVSTRGKALYLESRSTQPLVLDNVAVRVSQNVNQVELSKSLDTNENVRSYEFVRHNGSHFLVFSGQKS